MSGGCRPALPRAENRVMGQSVCLFLRHFATFATMPKKYVNPVRRCGYRGDSASKWARTNNISLQAVPRGSQEGNRTEGGGGGRRRSRCNSENLMVRRPVEQAQHLGGGGDDHDGQLRQVRERPVDGAPGDLHEHDAVCETPLCSALCYLTLNQAQFRGYTASTGPEAPVLSNKWPNRPPSCSHVRGARRL